MAGSQWLQTGLAVALVAATASGALVAQARAQTSQAGDNTREVAAETRAPAVRPSCIAVAKRRGGKADPIPETRKATFGHKPCARALKDCEIKLGQLKKRKRELDAACVVVRLRGV